MNTIFFINEATICGRVGNIKRLDEKLIYFSVATEENILLPNGQYKKETTWHNIKIIRPKTYMLRAGILKTGDIVLVRGRIENQVAEDGKRFSNIIAEEMLPFTASTERRFGKRREVKNPPIAEVIDEKLLNFMPEINNVFNH